MIKNKIYKIFFLVVIFAFNAGAQEISSEVNFSNNQLTKNNEDENQVKKSLLIDQAKNDLANILVGKKISSLMFDDQESDEIDRALFSLKTQEPLYEDILQNTNEDQQENQRSYIYLGSIIYINSQYWALWLNDQKITAKSNKPEKEFFVESIKKNQANIIWRISASKWKIITASTSSQNAGTQNLPELNADGEVEIRFELRPNQTFILTSKTIVEGRSKPGIKKQVDASVAIP